MKKTYHANTSQKKAGLVSEILDETDIKAFLNNATY